MSIVESHETGVRFCEDCGERTPWRYRHDAGMCCHPSGATTRSGSWGRCEECGLRRHTVHVEGRCCLLFKTMCKAMASGQRVVSSKPWKPK